MNRIHPFAPDELIPGCLNPTEARSLEHAEIRSAMHFIASNLENNLTIKDVADELQISRRTLELRFRSHLKCTIGHMLTRLRVAAACRLLDETELSASDISVDVGFASSSSMSNTLRRHLGKTATEIREGDRAYRKRAYRKRAGSRQAPDPDDSD